MQKHWLSRPPGVLCAAPFTQPSKAKPGSEGQRQKQREKRLPVESHRPQRDEWHNEAEQRLNQL